VALHEGRATGRYLAGLGIDVDLAPVVDVAAPGSFIASRSFGSDPRRVARLAGAFADGLGRSGVAATAKHFPGLGRAARNTDTSGSTIDAPLDVLRGDERPFAHAAHAGVPLVMVSTAVYPAFGTRVPAALSSAIVARELRGRLGFRGVTISDDLEAASVRAVTSPAAAAVAAAKAGVDVELLASTPSASEDAYRALLRAARRGELDRASVEAAYNRIAALVAKLEG
jgi:beta-N-acetylhexosaminidase